MSIKELVQTPFFLKKILNLSYDYNVEIDSVSSVESITCDIYIINLTIKKKNLLSYKDSIFVKFTSSNKLDVNYTLCHNEILFYDKINNSNKKINIVPRCIYADENDGQTLLILENISLNFYSIPKEKITYDFIFQCSISLAKLHSSFWNNEAAISSFGICGVKRQIDIEKSVVENFILYNFKHLSKRTIITILQAYKIVECLLSEISIRKKNFKNVTIINGDAHIYNFMFSKDKISNPMIIDFQFGEVGLGCLDLAHLTRKLPPKLITYDFCQKLIKNYHKSLKVNDYTYKECYLDYQKCIAAMVLNPIWQFHVLGIPPEICIQSLLEIINIYDFMNCQQLYKNHCLSSKKFVNNLYSEDNYLLSMVQEVVDEI